MAPALAATPSEAAGPQRLQAVTPAKPGLRHSYRELRWEELQPRDWDPAASFKKLDLSKLKDSDPRAIAATSTSAIRTPDAPRCARRTAPMCLP